VLTLRLVFHLALHQAEAFANSLLRLFEVELAIPDHTTLSRRGRGFAGRQPRSVRHDVPVHLVLDRTGLQLFGQGEWGAAKYGRARQQWRKLHGAVDAVTGKTAPAQSTDCWQQWQNGPNRFKELRLRGVPKFNAAVAAGSPTGAWRMSGHSAVQQALRNRFFDLPGLPRLYLPAVA
jgi:hypothetical protein